MVVSKQERTIDGVAVVRAPNERGGNNELAVLIGSLDVHSGGIRETTEGTVDAIQDVKGEENPPLFS